MIDRQHAAHSPGLSKTCKCANKITTTTSTTPSTTTTVVYSSIWYFPVEGIIMIQCLYNVVMLTRGIKKQYTWYVLVLFCLFEFSSTGKKDGDLKHTCNFCISCNASELVEVDFGF